MMEEETNIRKIFDIGIGEADGIYYALVYSLLDMKKTPYRSINLRILLGEVSKLVRRRNNYLHRFPLKEPSPIITLEQDRIYNPRIITPGNGTP